jgi:hypothetical protein
MGRLEYTLTNDLLSKMIFINNPYLLKDCVSKILDFDADTVHEFRIVNPSITKKNLSDKSPVLDILTEMDNKQVNLEIKSRRKRYYLDRVMFYATDLLSGALKSGGLYE